MIFSFRQNWWLCASFWQNNGYFWQVSAILMNFVLPVKQIKLDENLILWNEKAPPRAAWKIFKKIGGPLFLEKHFSKGRTFLISKKFLNVNEQYLKFLGAFLTKFGRENGKARKRVSGAFDHNCEKLWTPFTKLLKIVNAVHNCI